MKTERRRERCQRDLRERLAARLGDGMKTERQRERCKGDFRERLVACVGRRHEEGTLAGEVPRRHSRADRGAWPGDGMKTERRRERRQGDFRERLAARLGGGMKTERRREAARRLSRAACGAWLGGGVEEGWDDGFKRKGFPEIKGLLAGGGPVSY